MVEPNWSLIGLSGCLLLTRFLAAACVVPLVVHGIGLVWGIGLAVALAICLAPLAAEVTSAPLQPWYLMAVQEILLGISLGMSLSLLIAGGQLLANFVFAATPWGIAADGTPALPFRQLFVLIAIACFLHVRGDGILIQQLVGWLDDYPPGHAHVTSDVIGSIVPLLTACVSTILALASPLIATILFAHLLVGMVGRSLPLIWVPVVQGIAVPLWLAVLAACLVVLTAWLPAQLPGVLQVVGTPTIAPVP